MSLLERVGRAVPVATAVLLSCALGVSAQEAKPDLVWYGYVKLDASWDENVVNAGNFARWVLSPDAVDTHAHFNMTARQTRLGFRVQSTSGNAQITGRWESDFYGGGAENKNSLMVRHAYVEVVWPSGWKILAGQTSDVISPRVPNTLNYVVAWWAGNIGYRRPQVRLTRQLDLGAVDLTLHGAATRTIGDDFGGAEPGDSGTDSGSPTVQGHAALSWAMGSGTASIGIHGHRGRENLGHELGGEINNVSASGWGTDLTLPLGPLTLSGEFWNGSNLDDYFGGIGQGLRVDDSMAEAITSTGGWGEIAWRGGPTRVHAGFGLDDPDDADLMAGFRARNLALWSNVQRDLGGSLAAGLEISRWETRYIGMDEGSSLRVQTSVIYSF